MKKTVTTKMKKNKKSRYPDNIVWDEDNEKFHAFLLPYGSNISAPKIELVDVDSFKTKAIHKVDKIFNSELEEIAEKYYTLIDEVKLNNMVYNSKYSFEPLVGETYHLYKNKKGDNFLSLIDPKEWDEEHIISVKLNSDYKWVSTKDL